jgi:cobalt-precorrin-5B (C1)-methyltransferase
MSEEGLRDGLVCGLDIAKASGWKTIVLVPGNYGEQSVLQWFNFHREQVVQTSNFIGFMLEQAFSKGFTGIILAGHPGKLAKLMRGDLDTHSTKSPPATEVITSLLRGMSKDHQAISYCNKALSVEDQIQYLKEKYDWEVFDILARKLKTFSHKHLITDTIEIGVALFSLKKELIGITSNLESQLKTHTA